MAAPLRDSCDSLHNSLVTAYQCGFSRLLHSPSRLRYRSGSHRLGTEFNISKEIQKKNVGVFVYFSIHLLLYFLEGYSEPCLFCR